MAVQALNNMQYLWKSASKELKLKVLRTCIFPVATYGCETWVLRKLDIKSKSFWDEMLPQHITYTLDSSSHQLFNIKLTSSTNELAV